MVNKKQIYEARFDAMVRLAVISLNEKEMSSLPSAEEVRKTHVFSERHEKRMARLFAKEKRRNVLDKIRKVTYRTAAAVFVVLAAVFGILMFNDDVRASVVRVITEWFEQFTRFTFHHDEDIEFYTGAVWLPSFLPEGYEKVDVIQLTSIKIKEWQNEEGAAIILWRSSVGSTLETSNTQKQFWVDVYNGIEYHIFVGERYYDGTTIIWAQDGFAFTLSSDNALDHSKLLEMAISVEKR